VLPIAYGCHEGRVEKDREKDEEKRKKIYTGKRLQAVS
jgi:hypothetical protein